ncbi:response regulator transcription factor [Kribbella sp. NPDC048928]|uniref:response regulator transcription factor n=1 Tax=Kribbella sp. NPDC048928 TaxID=3364111 RepID=UPI0037162CAB
MSNQIRIVVVDGHTLTRFGLLGLVAGQPDLEVVGEAALAAEALATVAEAGADVIVLDTALPDGDGLRVARDLLDRHPGLGVVLLTSDGQDDVLFRALDAGVSAFVPKIAPAAEVLAAIRHAAVAAGSFIASGLGPAIARRRASAAMPGEDRPTAGPTVSLSPRETEVLQMLARGLPVAAIGAALYVSHSTAKTYVARLYEKLGATNRAQALMLGLCYGLIRSHQPTA